MTALPWPAKGDLISADLICELVRMAHWEQKIPPSSSPLCFAWATTVAAVADDDTTFDVKLVAMRDGSPYDGDGSTDGEPYLTVNKFPDGVAIDADVEGRIEYVKHGEDWDWWDDGFPCP